MPTFVYEALREPGQPLRGEIEADDTSAAAAALLSKGYHVGRIEDANALAARRMKPRLGPLGGLKRKDLVRLTRDTANLLKAGLPLAQALSVLASRSTGAGWRTVLTGVRSRIEDGKAFHEALASYAEIYDAMYIALVRAGEESGTLVESLNRLADVGELHEEIRTRVRMALVYPSVMMSVGAVTVFVMLAFVVPMFANVFEEMGQSLPLPTLMIVVTSHFLGTWWWAVLMGVPVAAFALVSFARSPTGKRALHTLAVRVPLAGPLTQRSEVAAFSRTLGTLLRSGLPIVTALHTTSRTLRNVLYQDAVRNMSAGVREGVPLSQALDSEAFFPKMASSIVAVGERSGDLAGCLLQMADENERDIDRQVKIVMTLLEPMMIVLLGIVVGFIVIAMLLPIFMLGDTLQL